MIPLEKKPDVRKAGGGKIEKIEVAQFVSANCLWYLRYTSRLVCWLTDWERTSCPEVPKTYYVRIAGRI